MSLTAYNEKRTFKTTPEPTGGKADAQQLHFVIQKHDASRLHYDFRLQMEGVLKSWAVPKGPSTDPSVKRLAMMVEDHPYDYRNFEGIIPKGQYGGGTVIVWDEGTYTPAEGSFKDKKSMEKNLLEQLNKGKLVFTLHGEKLKGDYALVKSSYQGETSWLLMKIKDKYAAKSDVTKKEKSVLSGKTIKQMEKAPDKVYGKKTITPGALKKDPVGKATKKKSDSKSPEKSIKKSLPSKKKSDSAHAGVKAKFPGTVAPMLATLVDKPFDADNWIYEIKWDGYRAIAHINKGKIALSSRNKKSFNEKFYPVYDALKEFQLDVILDGEIIVTGEDGISNFGKLQNWRSEADGQLLFYVFDLLWLNGYSLMDLPLLERREQLKEILPEHPLIHFSQAFDASGTAFFKAAHKMGLEGIMAKKADSIYEPGARSGNWLKIKIGKRHEVVIAGFTKNAGSSKTFSALLVGVFDKGKLRYTGKIGTGFSDARQKEMMKQFEPLIRKTSSFDILPDINKPSRFRPNPPDATATWLEPTLICEVSYTEITSDGVMRHPSFEGMRDDKKASEVKAEKAAPVKKLVTKSLLHSKKLITATPKASRKTLLNPKDEQQERNIGGNSLRFTNLSKLYWPAEKISKRDMLNYYYQVAPYMLPYLKDRPQSLNRHPGGIKGMSFYQKDVTGKVPAWIETFPYTSEGKNKHFMVCKNEASLLYMASLGCIEMNPWSSRIQSPDNPDWCIIDLDPSTNSFEQVIETANATRQILDAAGIASFCKTSGSTGLHIYIPLGAKYDYEFSKEFARLVATLVHEAVPSFTSIERATKDRKGKIYIDFLQNRPQATLAAPYSLRPKPGATVSMPLNWDEVKKGLQMKDFTIHNAIARIKNKGDIFKGVLGKGIDMKKALQRLQDTGN
ncbi:MAG: DNA ligase D [Chitinophagaceae bacterium]